MTITAIKSYAEFKQIINSGKPVVIDFWAAWCGPCRMVLPDFEKLSHKTENRHVGFYEVNIDEQEQITKEVGIKAVPTFIVFHNGVKAHVDVGRSPYELEQLVKQAAAL